MTEDAPDTAKCQASLLLQILSSNFTDDTRGALDSVDLVLQKYESSREPAHGDALHSIQHVRIGLRRSPQHHAGQHWTLVHWARAGAGAGAKGGKGRGKGRGKARGKGRNKRGGVQWEREPREMGAMGEREPREMGAMGEREPKKGKGSKGSKESRGKGQEG